MNREVPTTRRGGRAALLAAILYPGEQHPVSPKVLTSLSVSSDIIFLRSENDTTRPP